MQSNPPHKYCYQTRIGNWSEEWELEETKRKQYQLKKDKGISTVSQREKFLMRSFQSASITYSNDGLRHFGDHLMLFNAKSNGFLVTDIFDRLLNTEESYNISAAKKIHACARSVFIIQRVNMADGFKDNIIHYGQKFRIRINPMLIDREIFLYSEPSSVNRFSKVSRLQEVIFMLKNNYNTVWIFQHPDPNQRLQMQKQPIRVDDTVLIRHEMTNQWLASDIKTYQNTFGEEFQVMAHNFLVKSKSQNLVQQKKGLTTIDIPSRSQTEENLWLLLGASSPDQQFDESMIKKQTISRQFLEKKLKHLLTERGIYGIRFLHKVFRCLDQNKQGFLDQEDFKWGLQSGKIFVSEEEVSFIVQQYCNAQGKVSYKHFLNHLRGNVNEKRFKSIHDAYKRAQKVIGGNVTLEDLGKIYDSKRHPQVLTQRKTQQEAFHQFIWSWDNIKPNYLVEISEFSAYFEDLSAMIPRDEHFQYLLLNVLHL